MKRLKMLTKGPNKDFTPGDIVEVDDLRASLLLEGKHATEEMGEVKSWQRSSTKTASSTWRNMT
jgi:hypothetical protein